MAKEQTPHPSAILVSISKRSFWIYWIVCLLLYVANYFLTNPNLGKLRSTGVSVSILIASLLPLLLVLLKVTLTIKNQACA